MTTKTTDKILNLSGDWTLSGVVSQIDLMSHSLQKITTSRHKSFHIDCAKIDNIDLSGVQLLYVWLECARMRGIEPIFVNVPEKIRHKLCRIIPVTRTEIS